MRKLNRYNEPDFWINYKKAHKGEVYDDLQKTEEGRRCRRELRQYLLESQNYLCAYCCRSIGIDDSINEHIKPRASYEKESMNYDNIVVSCKTEGDEPTCSAQKENKYEKSLFVSPLDSSCEEHFMFYPNGEIDSDTTEGIYTKDLLRLNSYELIRARRAQYKICESYNDASMVEEYFLNPDEQGKLEPFADMVMYFYKKGMFSK